MQAAARAVSSVVIGMIAAPYFIWCWVQVAGHGLIFGPLFASGLRNTLLHVALASADFLASVVILLPVALALRCLGKARLQLHTGLAVLALFGASCAIVGWPAWPSSWQTLVGNLSPYIALWAGVWICAATTGRPPDNSFKPNPLRGSA